MNKLKICIISGSFPPIQCGVGLYTARLAETLEKGGFEISIITSKSASKKNFNFKIYPEIKEWNFRALLEIKKLLKKIKPDIINIQYPTTEYKKNLAINLLPLCLRIFYTGLKIISTVHEFSNYTKIGKLRLLINILASHKVIVVDEFEQKEILNFFPFISGKIVYVPLGPSNLPVKIKNFNKEKTRKKLGIDKDIYLLVYHGFIQKGKGFGFLLKALKILLDKGLNVKLLVIGDMQTVGDYSKDYNKKVKKYQKEMKEIIDHYNLKSHIIWTGYVSGEKLSKYFYISDLAIFPFDDGASTKRSSLMTAIAHKIPVITTYVEGYTPSIFLKLGLIPPYNEYIIAESIKEIMYSADLQKELKKMVEDVSKVLSWENVGERISKVFKRL